MEYNELLNLTKSRQACREFNDKPLEKEKLEKIIELARLTPSACNSQPWRVYCAYSKQALEKVSEALTVGGGSTFLKKAKAFMVLSETSANYKPDVAQRLGQDFFVKYDIGAIATYITLSAKSLGVDSIIIGRIDKDILRKALNLPENEKVGILVALGYSDIATREKIRKPVEDIIEYI